MDRAGLPIDAAVGFDVPSVLDESPDNARQNGSADRQARGRDAGTRA